MKKEKKVSPLTIIGRGIKQAARWVARMFGYKADTKFGRILWYVFATCACVLVLYVAIEIVWGYVTMVQWNREARLQQRPEYCHSYWNSSLSDDIIYHDEYDDGYIYNKELGTRTVTGISWIRKSEDGDNLVCFKKGEQRGYFDLYTGEAVIPAKYEKAWIFSEGLACVMLDGKLGFIDHSGNMVIDNVFDWTPYIGAYCFHQGLCSMKGDDGKIGLIDKKGEWVVEPECVYMERVEKGYWKVADSCWSWGLIEEPGQVVLPCEFGSLYIDYNDFVRTRTLDHVDQVYDIKGNLLNACDYMGIESIEYAIDENGDYDTQVKAAPHCLKYRTFDNHYGLMSRDGKNITLPLYSNISAISEDRYLCIGMCGSIILDDKGNECGEKQ